MLRPNGAELHPTIDLYHPTHRHTSARRIGSLQYMAATQCSGATEAVELLDIYIGAMGLCGPVQATTAAFVLKTAMYVLHFLLPYPEQAPPLF